MLCIAVLICIAPSLSEIFLFKVRQLYERSPKKFSLNSRDPPLVFLKFLVRLFQAYDELSCLCSLEL